MKVSEFFAPLRAAVLVFLLGISITGVATLYLLLETNRESQVDFEKRSALFARQAQVRIESLVSGLRVAKEILESAPAASGAFSKGLDQLRSTIDAPIPGMRWFGILRLGGNNQGWELMFGGAGAKEAISALEVKKFSGGLATAVRDATDRGGPVIHVADDTKGVPVPLLLESVGIAGKVAGADRYVLVAGIELRDLLREDIEGFRMLEEGDTIDRYSLRIVSPGGQGGGVSSSGFFSLRGTRPGEQLPSRWSLTGDYWMHFDRPIRAAGADMRVLTGVPRTEIPAPEEEALWWILILGVVISLAIAVLVARHALERKSAEEVSKRLGSLARHSEARFRDLVESTRDWMWETDANGRITYSSGSVFHQLGYEPAEIVGKAFHEIGVSIDLESAALGAARVEVPARNKLGESLWMQCACTRFVGEDGAVEGYRGVCIDVTERRRNAEAQRNLEVELNRLDKLGALDHVMSMVAHELNQPLAAVSSYCGASIRMLRSNPRELDEVISALTAATSQAKAASDAVRGIRQFVARREPSIGAHRIEKLVRDALSLVEFRVARGRVNVQTSFSPGLSAVLADSILVVQVILNLLHNALDSLANTLEPRIVISAWSADADWVHVSVSDNGPGLTEEVAARGLEPYFTTKSTGLGLGLSIAQTIIESHGGELRLKNNPGGGCDASFTLEASARDVPVDEREVEAAGAVRA